MDYLALLIAPIIFILVGVVIIFIGFYIRKSKNIEIINQVNKRKAYDRNGLSNFAGMNAIIMGLSLFVTSIFNIVLYLLTESMMVFYVSYVVYFVLLLYFSLKITFAIKKYQI